MRTTQEVIEHHLQAFGEGLESILSDYDDNSCIISQQGTFTGMNEIREFFAAFIAGLPEGFMESFNITGMEVKDEVGYITWEAKPWFPLGTDTFVVNNGKFSFQTFAVYASDI